MRINIVYAARDPNRAGALLEAVARSGFTLTTAQRGKEVMGLLGQRSCDVLIVAAQLADDEGLTLVKSLRSRGPTRQLPIIALLESDQGGSASPIAGFGTAAGQIRRDHAPAPSAPAPSPAGKVSLRLAFFQAGADECLMLNQDIAESVARIKAVLRRTMTNPAEEVIKTGPVELNLTSYTLHVNGKEVPLTSKELDLLYVLLSSPNRVLSRPYLIERVWGYNYFGSPRTVDVHVRRLREKLGKAASLIHTIPCVGYKLIPPGTAMSR
ncbi:MAG: response regulator transcription factor [Elusimicrobia bacterium]|nr:response regulator transcription factor [Elusimicrobiota bacterium]